MDLRRELASYQESNENLARELIQAITAQSAALERQTKVLEEQTEMQRAFLLVQNQNMIVNHRQLNELKATLIQAIDSDAKDGNR